MAAQHTVEAKLPGIFYRRPSPEADPYVEVGDSVVPGDTVGLIELMKSYHEVKAEVQGKIVAFLVENEGEVESGDGLLTIEAG